jgi:hypothetical protein
MNLPTKNESSLGEGIEAESIRSHDALEVSILSFLPKSHFDTILIDCLNDGSFTDGFTFLHHEELTTGKNDLGVFCYAG